MGSLQLLHSGSTTIVALFKLFKVLVKGNTRSAESLSLIAIFLTIPIQVTTR